MVSGAQPPDIAEFELNIDPYANVIPRASRMVRAGSPDDSVESTTTRSPLLRWISIILILILVLPVMVEVFARLIH